MTSDVQKWRCNIPRKIRYITILDVHEKQKLQQIAQKYRSPYFEVIRVRVILFASEGLENKEIGKRLELSRQIVSKWRKRFFEERLAGLQDRPGKEDNAIFPPHVVLNMKALSSDILMRQKDKSVSTRLAKRPLGKYIDEDSKR